MDGKTIHVGVMEEKGYIYWYMLMEGVRVLVASKTESQLWLLFFSQKQMHLNKSTNTK